MRKTLDIQVVWHLTIAILWLGSFAPLAGGRFVFGPAGGGVSTPWRLGPALGWRGVAREARRDVTRWLSRVLNPAVRLAWSRADLLIVPNPEARRWLPRRHRDKAVILPHAVIEDGEARPSRRGEDGKKTMLFAGVLMAWKGPGLAIRALTRLPDWRLIVCGSGSDEEDLKRLAKRLGVNDRVDFRGWRKRDELLTTMREEATLLVLPALHDDAPHVVTEALSQGLPVVCLDRGGPPLLGGHGVPVSGLRETVEALARTIEDCAAGRLEQPAKSDTHFEKIGGVLRESGLIGDPAASRRHKSS